MLYVSGVWGVSAAIAFLLVLAAAVGTILAVAKLWRFRMDGQVIDAAERLEAVNLGTVVKRYVPSELQTQNFTDEIAIARQVISSRRPGWKRIAMISGVVLLCSATVAAYFTRRNLEVIAAAQLAAKPRLNLDVLRVIQGVWGWRADFLESCAENPQTVVVSPDHKNLSVRYAKPFKTGSSLVTDLEFDVISAKPDMLVLTERGTTTSTESRPAQVYINFLDANTYSLSRSDDPMKSSGAIVRCPQPQAAKQD